MVEIWLRGDPQDGNDPLEATVKLAHIPRPGDMIEVWDSQGGSRTGSNEVACPECAALPGMPCEWPEDDAEQRVARWRVHSTRTRPVGEPRWLKVDAVIWHPYNAELDRGGEIEIAVTYDGYSLDEFQRTMEAAKNGELP